MESSTNPKPLHDLEASLAVIQVNVRAFKSGIEHAYRPIAVELRKLLCDMQRKTDRSLLKLLFPDLHLHPLRGNQSFVDEYTVLYIPALVYPDGRGGSNIIEFFNESAPSIPIDEWLQQKLFDNSMTIEGFIRSVANKESAHSDPSYNSTLLKTKSVFLANSSLASQTIVAIGCYIVKALAIRLLRKNIAEIGAFVISEYNKKGRGIVILDLVKFSTRFSDGIPIKYEPTSVAESYFLGDSKIHKTTLQILQNYQPLKEFILLIIELNGEHWLYKQIIHSGA